MNHNVAPWSTQNLPSSFCKSVITNLYPLDLDMSSKWKGEKYVTYTCNQCYFMYDLFLFLLVLNFFLRLNTFDYFSLILLISTWKGFGFKAKKLINFPSISYDGKKKDNIGWWFKIFSNMFSKRTCIRFETGQTTIPGLVRIVVSGTGVLVNGVSVVWAEEIICYSNRRWHMMMMMMMSLTWAVDVHNLSTQVFGWM